MKEIDDRISQLNKNIEFLNEFKVQFADHNLTRIAASEDGHTIWATFPPTTMTLMPSINSFQIRKQSVRQFVSGLYLYFYINEDHYTLTMDPFIILEYGKYTSKVTKINDLVSFLKTQNLSRFIPDVFEDLSKKWGGGNSGIEAEPLDYSDIKVPFNFKSYSVMV